MGPQGHGPSGCAAGAGFLGPAVTAGGRNAGAVPLPDIKKGNGNEKNLCDLMFEIDLFFHFPGKWCNNNDCLCYNSAFVIKESGYNVIPTLCTLLKRTAKQLLCRNQSFHPLACSLNAELFVRGCLPLATVGRQVFEGRCGGHSPVLAARYRRAAAHQRSANQRQRRLVQ